jgi:hypothetical protein
MKYWCDLKSAKPSSKLSTIQFLASQDAINCIYKKLNYIERELRVLLIMFGFLDIEDDDD